MELNDDQTVRTPVTEDLRSNNQQRLAWVFGLTFASMILGVSVTRSVPGGPFISMTGDILPVLFAFAAIKLGFTSLRVPNSAPKLIACVFIILAAIALAASIADVYTFGNRPYARGTLIGF